MDYTKEELIKIGTQAVERKEKESRRAKATNFANIQLKAAYLVEWQGYFKESFEAD